MKGDTDIVSVQGCHEENVEKQKQDRVKFEDVGAKVVDVNHVRVVTPAENRTVLRRIDFFVLPLLFISYGLQFMDKGLLGNAAQFGIIEDLHLYQITVVDGVKQTSIMRFSYATLIFYWGFVAGCKSLP